MNSIKLLFFYITFIFYSGNLSSQVKLIKLTDLKNQNIISVIDNDSTKYFVSNEGVGCVNKYGELNFIKKNNENENYNFLFKGEDGIWVASEKGHFLKIKDNVIINNYTTENVIKSFRLSIIKFLVVNNYVWVLDTSKTLYVFESNFSKKCKILNEYGKVFNIDIDYNNNLFVLTEKGLFILDYDMTFIKQVENFNEISAISLIEKKAFINEDDFYWFRILLPKQIKNEETLINLVKKRIYWTLPNISKDIKYIKVPYLINSSANLLKKYSTINEDNKELYSLITDGNNLFKFEMNKRKVFLFQGKEITENINIEIENLLFVTNDSIILKESYKVLDELTNLLKESQDFNINLEGHTSKGVNPPILKQISLSRANAVKTYLIQNGIEENRINTFGFGDTDLKDTQNPESDYNKRVEVALIRRK